MKIIPKHLNYPLFCQEAATTISCISIKELNNKDMCHEGLEHHIELGFRFLDLMEAFIKAFTFTIDMEYFFNSIMEAFGMFFATFVLSSFGDNGVNTVQLTAGLGYFAIGMAGMIRFLVLVSIGNDLTDVMKASRDIVLKLKMDTKGLEDEVKFKIEVLLGKMGRSAAIQPHGVYDVSKSSALSLQGLIFTYIIVLVQFRMV